MLRDLGQWAGDAPGAVACGSPAGEARSPRLMRRLERLEAVADAASVRFDELQREHAALKRRYRKLKEKHEGAAAS